MAASRRGRSGARRAALQALYQWQLAGHEPGDIVREFVAERELVGVDRDYFRALACGIPAQLPALRALIEEVVDRDWSRLDPVARAALLIGTYELAGRAEVPWRVVVNEAVELAKLFGAEEGHKFVNAALDRLARRLRPEEVPGCSPAGLP